MRNAWLLLDLYADRFLVTRQELPIKSCFVICFMMDGLWSGAAIVSHIRQRLRERDDLRDFHSSIKGFRARLCGNADTLSYLSMHQSEKTILFIVNTRFWWFPLGTVRLRTGFICCMAKFRIMRTAVYIVLFGGGLHLYLFSWMDVLFLNQHDFSAYTWARRQTLKFTGWCVWFYLLKYNSWI